MSTQGSRKQNSGLSKAGGLAQAHPNLRNINPVMSLTEP